MNKGTSKIRLSKKTKRKVKSGDEKSINLITRPHHKFNNGVMVSGGICNEGLGEIIFHSGNLNSFAYKQVLKYYREDLNKFPLKFFQQDGARSHSSKFSRNMIQFLFKDKFIPTWDGGLKINDKFVPRWPPNSPDLSAIEVIWAIIKQMLILFPRKDMNGLKKAIKMIWDSMPKNI
jgi:transposase